MADTKEELDAIVDWPALDEAWQQFRNENPMIGPRPKLAGVTALLRCYILRHDWQFLELNIARCIRCGVRVELV